MGRYLPIEEKFVSGVTTTGAFLWMIACTPLLFPLFWFAIDPGAVAAAGVDLVDMAYAAVTLWPPVGTIFAPLVFLNIVLSQLDFRVLKRSNPTAQFCWWRFVWVPCYLSARRNTAALRLWQVFYAASLVVVARYGG